MANKIVKLSEEEGAKLLQMQREREMAMKNQRTKEPEDQNVKVYTRPDMREGAEQPPNEQLERQELNRKLRAAQMEKEEEPEEEQSFSERHPRLAEAGEAIKWAGHNIKEELKRVSKNAERLEKKEPAEEEEEEEESKPSKKSKKPKHSEMEENFGEKSESMSSRSSGKKPFSEDYKEVYSGKKVMFGDYKEVYKGQMGSDNYNPPKVPKTHGNFLKEQHPPQKRTQQPVTQPVKLKPRAPIKMPTIGGFGNNVKMPTVSFGGGRNIPKITTPSMGTHKIGKGSMPSINIPTLIGSTLIVGTGLMGKTANNKMSTGSFNIPKIGNWGKAPLKTELNLPDIGNLTIMGAGKKKGGIGISLGGEIPRFALAAPQKKKKV